MIRPGEQVTWTWAPGTTITRETGASVRVSVPALGRAWRLDRQTLGVVLRWVAEPDGTPPDLVGDLLNAGLLVVAEVLEGRDLRWTPVRRFHTWAAHDNFLDGADPSGTIRQEVLARFDSDDVALIRGRVVRDDTSIPSFSTDLANVVWQATSRLRANRARVLGAVDTSALLFSYGAAHELVVADAAAQNPTVAWADLKFIGHGHPIAADPAVVLGEAQMDEAQAAILVVGKFEDYQRRYRHEKAMRGFLVDGGRLLGEVSRAIVANYGAAIVNDDLPWSSFVPLLALDADHFLVGAVGIP